MTRSQVMVGPHQFENLKGGEAALAPLVGMLTLPFLYLPSGHVNFTISTEIVDSNELCGGRKGVVPNRGRSDTLIKPVLVKVSVFQDGCPRRRPQPHRMLSAPPPPPPPVSFTVLTLSLQSGSFCALLRWPIRLRCLPDTRGLWKCSV